MTPALRDTGGVTQQQGTEAPAAEPVAAPPTRKRGRETAADMVRSLAVVMVVVVAMWFFAQASPSDEQPRLVDQSEDVAALRGAVPAAPVPQGLPAGWQPQVSDFSSAPTRLRLGWRTPSQQYAEYAAVVQPDAERLQELVGSDQPLGPVQIDAASWERYRSGDALSFVRTAGGATVVVGTKRSSATETELRTLIGSLSAGRAP